MCYYRKHSSLERMLEVMQEELKSLEQELKRIKDLGYVKNVKKGKNGELATFFKILKDRNICQMVDLKLKKDFTRNYMTIFNAKPVYKGKNDVKRLWEKYGYFENNDRRKKVLKTSVQANCSTLVGNRFLFKLKIDYENEKIFLLVFDRAFQLLECSSGWTFDSLREIYDKKRKYLVLIRAWEQVIEKNRHYRYYDYYVWQLKSFEEFLKLIEDGTIRVTFKVDFHRKEPKIGLIDDKGVSFEIQELELERLYNKG